MAATSEEKDRRARLRACQAVLCWELLFVLDRLGLPQMARPTVQHIAGMAASAEMILQIQPRRSAAERAVLELILKQMKVRICPQVRWD